MSEPKENLVMEHHVSLTYTEQLTPNLDRYVDALIDGHIVGHKCPQCGRVYVPRSIVCFTVAVFRSMIAIRLPGGCDP